MFLWLTKTVFRMTQAISAPGRPHPPSVVAGAVVSQGTDSRETSEGRAESPGDTVQGTV